MDYGTIEQTQPDNQNDLDNNNNQQNKIIEYIWKVPNFWDLVNTDQELVMSSRFYTTEPNGYRLQMMLTPNTTYSDGQGYVGTFFRIVTGVYDEKVQWPYKLKTVLTIIDHKLSNTTTGAQHNGTGGSQVDYLRAAEGQSFTVVPNTDTCRLRSAFLRPSADQDFNPNPDGCGNRRHISLQVLADNTDRYFKDNALYVKLAIHLVDYGQQYRTAVLTTKYNQMVSYYEWSVLDYPSVQNQSFRDEKIAVLTSEPFYTHKNGYLMQLFLTLLPKRNAFAVSLAMAPGDHDRYLQWPFPYKFEVAIVDQSPGYWRRDYTIAMQPSTSECGTDPFLQPSPAYPEFCFLTVQSMALLSLTHYNFVVNNTLKISFMTKMGSYLQQKQASLVISDDHKLVAQYTWLIPQISGKLDKFDLVRDKPKMLASEEFYTNGQGYLCQILLTLNRTEGQDFEMGLELGLLEGEYDSVLEWPFNKTYELSLVRQRVTDNTKFGTETNGTEHSEAVTGHRIPDSEFTRVIIPVESECGRQSFQKPIERNTPCGHTSRIPFDRISRANDILKTGSLLVKIRIYL